MGGWVGFQLGESLGPVSSCHGSWAFRQGVKQTKHTRPRTLAPSATVEERSTEPPPSLASSIRFSSRPHWNLPSWNSTCKRERERVGERADGEILSCKCLLVLLSPPPEEASAHGGPSPMCQVQAKPCQP